MLAAGGGGIVGVRGGGLVSTRGLKRRLRSEQVQDAPTNAAESSVLVSAAAATGSGEAKSGGKGGEGEEGVEEDVQSVVVEVHDPYRGAEFDALFESDGELTDSEGKDTN